MAVNVLIRAVQFSLNFKLFSKYDLKPVRLLKLYTAIDFYSGMAVRKLARLPTYLTFVVDLFGISGERPLKYSVSVLRRAFINQPSVLILSLMHFSKHRQAAQVTRLAQCNTGVCKKGFDSSWRTEIIQ